MNFGERWYWMSGTKQKQSRILSDTHTISQKLVKRSLLKIRFKIYSVTHYSPHGKSLEMNVAIAPDGTVGTKIDSSCGGGFGLGKAKRTEDSWDKAVS